MKTFSKSVKEVVMKIPKSKIMSYKGVVLSNGKLGGYNRGGEEAKRLLLRKEGVIL